MNRLTRRAAATALALASVAAAAGTAFAQSDFPSKPIRIVVPFTAGSGADSLSRLFADPLSQELKQPVIVENHPGANGLIGLQAVKNAPADGYTIGIGGAFHVVYPVVTKNATYSPDDYRTIAGLAIGPMVLIVGPDSPYKTLDDFLKKKTGPPINVGTYTATYQLGMLWLAQVSGVPLANVPYKGAAQVTTDLNGGHLEAAVVDFTAVKPLIKSGKLRALAISAGARAPDFPDVPTIKERFPEYELYVWTSLMVRKDTPDAIVNKLAAAMVEAKKTPKAKEFFETSGYDMNMRPPDDMNKFQAEEFARYKRIAAAAGVKPE